MEWMSGPILHGQIESSDLQAQFLIPMDSSLVRPKKDAHCSSQAHQHGAHYLANVL